MRYSIVLATLLLAILPGQGWADPHPRRSHHESMYQWRADDYRYLESRNVGRLERLSLLSSQSAIAGSCMVAQHEPGDIQRSRDTESRQFATHITVYADRWNSVSGLPLHGGGLRWRKKRYDLESHSFKRPDGHDHRGLRPDRDQPV